MISILYMPFLLYDIITTYLFRGPDPVPEKPPKTRSKYNKNTTSKRKLDKKLLEQQHQIKKPKSDSACLAAAAPVVTILPAPVCIPSIGIRHQPEPIAIEADVGTVTPDKSHPKPQVMITLSESEESDFDDLIVGVASITTTHQQPQDNHTLPFSTPQHQDPAVSSTQEDIKSSSSSPPYAENSHIEFIGDPPPSLRQSYHNSFLDCRKDDEIISGVEPELPSYNGEEAADVQNAAVGGEVFASGSRTNDDDDDVYEDAPIPAESLTSMKNPLIKKYVPKVKQPRKRSDLEWNQYMEKCMLKGSRNKVLTSLRLCFREAFDAYQLGCDLIITFGVTHASGRTIFQRTVISELEMWKSATDGPRPSLSNQLKALDVSYLCNSTLFKPLCEVYELKLLSREEAVLFIHDKLDHKCMKYLKHMAFIISELNLQEYFDTPEILLPLLSMDKLMVIESYLSDTRIAGIFVKSLDELLDPDGVKLSQLLTRLERDFEYAMSTAQFKFTSEQLVTLIKRLVKLHNLPSTAAPLLSETKTISNLRSLLFCKYRKGATEDWTDMIVDTVKNSDILQQALFDELSKYNDIEYAAILVERIKPNPDILPEQLKGIVNSKSVADNLPNVNHDENSRIAENGSTSNWGTFVEDGPKSVSSSKIKQIRPKSPVVDPETGFVALPRAISVCEVATAASLKVCQDILSSASTIGLDSEWRALMDPTQVAHVALLQLSCHNTTFLLDIPHLLNCTTEKEIQEFVNVVFDDQLIVGYGLVQDFRKIAETSSIFGDKLSNYENVIDLAIPHKHLTKAQRSKRSAEIRAAVSAGQPLPEPANISQHTGLSRLSEVMFSAPMDKTCQISDWTRRPLSVQQKMYAALDAFILLPLYFNLVDLFHPTRLQDLKSEVDDVYDDGRCFSYIQASSHPTPVEMMRVVVDVMCQGLGKKLRHIGIDCIILDEGQTVDDAAKISLAEGRIILSRDSNCEKLMKLTDSGRVYKVEAVTATEQLAEIRKHFNIVVKDEDLFSRCAICNCGHFVRLEPEEAKALKLSQEMYTCSTVDLPAEVYERRVQFVEKINISTDGMTQYGVRLQLDNVNINKFSETKTFWGCYDCGKMYWDGCHLRNFKEKHGL